MVPHIYLDSGDGLVMLSGGVEVIRSGGHPHVLLGAQGIKVFWDGMNLVEVTVSSSWQGRLCGLCGDYNGDSTDDFIRLDGQQVSNGNEFAASWVEVVEDPSSCGTLPQADPCFGTNRPIAIVICNTLQSSTFVSTVDPPPFIDSCMMISVSFVMKITEMNAFVVVFQLMHLFALLQEYSCNSGEMLFVLVS